MKLWLQKISVILITFITLGTFIPPTYLDAHAENKEEVISSDSHKNTIATVTDEESPSDEYEVYDSSEFIIAGLAERAKEQTITKMGPRIIKQVEEDISSVILPNIEEVVKIKPISRLRTIITPHMKPYNIFICSIIIDIKDFFAIP